MATTNYNLPTITGESPVAIVDDYNALANATDAALAGAISGEKTRAMAAETELANGVSNALTTANSANVSATDAKSAADKAQTTADKAQTTADTANTLATKAESNAEAIQKALSNLLNFEVVKTVSDDYANVTVAINKSNTLYKCYGRLRVNAGQTLQLTAVPGMSNRWGYKIDIGGKLATETAYKVTAGGAANWDAQAHYFQAMESSFFAVGTDGNIYLYAIDGSSISVASGSDIVVFQAYPACLYVNANFGDSPISPEPTVTIA